LVAGLAVKTEGLIVTTNVYGSVVVVLALLALAGLLTQRAARPKAA
jgi:hypothetical protein